MKYDFVPNAISQKIRDEKLKIEQLSDRDFEYYIADMFRKLGYDADVTPASNDGGKDIVLIKSGKRYYVECKHFAECDLVGRPIIQKAFGAAMMDYVAGCFIVTSSRFNSNAIEEATKTRQIYLMDIDDISYINVFYDGYLQEAFNNADKYSILKRQYLNNISDSNLNIKTRQDYVIHSKKEKIVDERKNGNVVSQQKTDDKNNQTQVNDSNIRIASQGSFLGKLFDHYDRIPKSIFWLRFFTIIATIVCFSMITYNYNINIPAFLNTALILFYIWWFFDAVATRFHDIDKSGWKALYMLIPYVNFYFLFKLLFKDGTLGNNQYGHDPYVRDRYELERIKTELEKKKIKLDEERKIALEKLEKEIKYEELNRKYENEKKIIAKAEEKKTANADLEIYYDEGNSSYNQALLFRDEGYLMLRPTYKNTVEYIMLKDITNVEFKFSAYTQTDIDEGSSGIGEAALGYAVGGWKGAAAGYYLGSSDDEISTSDKWSMLLIVETVNKDNPVYVFANEVVTETDCNNYKRMYALLKHYARK